MTITIEFIHRSPGSSAVGIAAQRLGQSLADRRSGFVHDHRLRRDPRRNPVATVAPDGAESWAADTAELWSKVEWCERLGGAPILGELRIPQPPGVDVVRARVTGDAVARFVACELQTSVSCVVLDGISPYPVRDDEGVHIRLCFPTRRLALPDQTHGVVDRSGQPSGFAARLDLVSNPHLAARFTERLAVEVERIARVTPSPMIPVQPATTGEHPSMTRVREEVRRLTTPVRAPSPGSALLERLRLEAPVMMTEKDQLDFDFSLGIAKDISEALALVTSQASELETLINGERRVRSHALDFSHQLDLSRASRAKACSELAALKAPSTPRFVFFGHRIELAVLARAGKAKEIQRHHEHVGELKTAVASLQTQAAGLAVAARDSGFELNYRRTRLQSAVRRLHGQDPGLLHHLLGLLTGQQRVHLKDAMRELGETSSRSSVDSSTDEGGGGLRAKPTRAAPR